ncbi:hypothetical protein K493DRAFT_374925 [Basidiobolus meristosporus CBS 931.73]|uniref:Velvet domain-containing protein n=1 Tax=Basidiobolus meristosporus CBS 931.73 TaxID=1314790 RepID=A0A1Y1Y6I2_9FUNG|nr:hypothetical protein K493DRAFT_374925 [Basidiobolus meristosporus CBS 931.73]|eukprot:ORX93622.1 hypothetical protein K493DRAFT_374925 [Basidiobolus meristosporus CBS 931.73]
MRPAFHNSENIHQKAQELQYSNKWEQGEGSTHKREYDNPQYTSQIAPVILGPSTSTPLYTSRQIMSSGFSYGNSPTNRHSPSFNAGNARKYSYMQQEPESLKRSYELHVRQHPLHARMCGFGEKDRRPIDPPPIIQLLVRDQRGRIDTAAIQDPFYVLHVTLWSEDRQEERNIITSNSKCTRVLMGSLVASANLLKNPEGEQGCYFCFPDLSIRIEGRYCLKFNLIRLGGDIFRETSPMDANSKVLACAFSEAFTVFSAKKFPGMTESTELSKAFAKQGLKIPIRNDVRSRRSED